jgi:DNA-binding CsgD family transcriptional regulator
MAERWPLAARGEELRVISEALGDDASHGMVVAGLAGVGKTRLARAAVDAAANAGWAVHRVAGTASGRSVTLGAFARWADDTDASPLALTRSVFAAMTASANDAPLLLFIDDAHLLDEMSAFIVHQLVLQDMAKVIVTMRTGEAAPDAVTALWKDGLLGRLELQPLSHNESDELLTTVLDGSVNRGCVERMWKLSRGNVLFLHHLVEHERESGRLAKVDNEWRWAGTQSVSPSLVELVVQQIGTVPDDVRDVVDLVAISEPVSRELLLALTDTSSIEAAEQRELIDADIAADAIRVGHPLYGEVRLSQCGPLRLRRLRGRVATAMAEANTADPLRLGLLWLESDLPPDAGILSRAARTASSRLDIGAAERLCRAALAAEASPEIKLLLAHALFLQERGEEAEEILSSLDSDGPVPPGFLNRTIQRAANLMWPLRRAEDAQTVIEEALARGDDAHTDSLRTFRAVGHIMAGGPAAAIETMSTVSYDHLDNLGRIVGYTVETLAFAELGRPEEATLAASAGNRVLAESPFDSFQSTGLAEFHAYALLAAGYVDEAAVVAEQENQRCVVYPGVAQWMASAALGLTAVGKGDLTAALPHFRSASEGFGEHGDGAGVFDRIGIPRTEALARSGHVDEAIASLQSLQQSRHPTWRFLEPDYLLATAWVSAAQDRIAEAREITSHAAEFARSHGQPAREVLCLQTAVQLGDTSGAERLAELATQVQGVRAPLAARYARSLARDDGAGLDAVSHDFEGMGDVLAAADAAAQAAASFRLAGLRGSALTASARAQSLAKQCGDAVSPALRAAQVPLPFTRREHEIVNLLANGLSNKAIAEATSLSTRTVEGHIFRASAKAGVSSRSELAALVKQFGELA